VALFAGTTVFMLSGGLMRGRGKARIPLAPASAFGNSELLAGFGKVE
jgi:hypothetical protein